MGPFDRFNDRAKRVLALAQDEAVRFNHNYIGPEHLMLGLIREGEGVAAHVLDSFGIKLSAARTQVEAIVGRGQGAQPSEIILIPRSRNVIDLALEEARKLGHAHVGTEHLLLGLAREMKPTDVAGTLLAWFGVSLEQVYERTRGAILGTPGWKTAVRMSPAAQPAATMSHSGPFDRFDDSGKRVLALAQDEAIRLNHNYIGTEHLLAGLMRGENTVAVRALTELGVSLEKVRSALEFIIGRGDQPTTPSDITLSPRTKKVIELAIDEARRLGHAHVGPGHILLGLVREGEGIASGILESLGLTLAAVRRKVLDLMQR